MRLAPSAGGLAQAAAFLRARKLVAFPTETVYGLGADATSERAVAKIFAAKDRPTFNPLIVHVGDMAAADAIAELSPTARALAEAFWPGPLTLVAPRRAGSDVAELATAGLPTIALRVPAHPIAQSLLRLSGRPIAAPSANRSGRLSPTLPEHVFASLDGRIDGVVAGGATEIGLESTIVAVDGDEARVLRAGGVTLEAIAEALGRSIDGPSSAPAEAPRAPGMLASHYAPRAQLALNRDAPQQGEAWLGFGPDPAQFSGPSLNLSPSSDLVEAAAALFAQLHQLDEALDGDGVIAVATIPETGLGRAINDRLRRAAAPR